MAKRRAAGKPPETKAIVEEVSRDVRHRVTCGSWSFEQDDVGDWMVKDGDGMGEWVHPHTLTDLKACVDAMHEIEQKNGGDESNG